MPEIKVLSQETINQIAAGEVIDRPSSVVKELLENAIDAGATAVTVEIRNGGISFVRVTDNGCGIEKSQIATAFLRHATSKIHTALDLLTVSSLGFRGEALSSIAAVARVELITKTAGELTGSHYQIHGGEEISMEEIGAPEGTTFLVRELFYNTPARKKFLKSPQTEGAYISSLIERIALSRPDISIRFIQNNQNRLHTTGNRNLNDLIYMIFGREIAGNLLPIERTEEQVQLSGFLGKPLISRGNRTYENYFINGRYIKSSLINKAIEDGYHSYLMQHKYPFVVLHLKIHPELLDVNVHPSKMELRFSNQEEIYNLIRDAVKETLSGKELIRKVSLSESAGSSSTAKKQEYAGRLELPDYQKQSESSGSSENQKRSEDKPAKLQREPGTLDAFKNQKIFGRAERGPEPFEVKRSLASAIPPTDPPGYLREPVASYHAPSLATHPVASVSSAASYSGQESSDRSSNKEALESSLRPENLYTQRELFDEKLLSPQARTQYQFIGQLFDTYWLIQYKEELFIVDQHAAHEKVLYERLVKQLTEKAIYSQMVSPPILLTLNTREEEILTRFQERFSQMGFEIEPFGGKEYAVSAVPANLYGIAQKELLLELLDSLSDEFSKESGELLLEKLASMSCKAAVKGGDSLSHLEAEALIDELLTLENPYACPHGRPTIISMSRRELEKKFKRII
ncbi:MAG: DNA mismatch repair endonuclease MutL [Lachnospiraceae bacterium]|nr:DNA mismatch repair endonuclease MutL [Lachnospiraceae bacterium]